MKRTRFHDLPRKRLQKAFVPLSLAERQLLLLGLWVIGEENRVDPRLIVEWRALCGQLHLANEQDLLRQHREGPR